MNHAFSTGSERIAVLEGLRKPAIIFPNTWDPRRSRQRQSESYSLSPESREMTYRTYKVITKLLNHDPDQRPSALELSQDPLLPPRIEDEYYMDILKKMGMIPYVRMMNGDLKYRYSGTGFGISPVSLEVAFQPAHETVSRVLIR